MTRPYFIVNPESGSGNGRALFEKARELLDSRGVEYGFVFSKYPKHTVSLAQEALERGERFLVSVGGDGTLQEVASAVAGREDVWLGILPFGTGNDFARFMGYPEDVESLVEVLLSGRVKRIDAGDANGLFFINVAGFGFDVDVVKYTEKYKKKLNGMLPYMLGIMKALLDLRACEVSVETDGGETFQTGATLFSACNGGRFAGGIRLAPEAKADDGLLDICILKGVSKLTFLYLLPKYMKGKHVGDTKHFHCFKARRVRAVTRTAQTMDLDGELAGETPVEFSVRPGAINLVAGV